MALRKINRRVQSIHANRDDSFFVPGETLALLLGTSDKSLRILSTAGDFPAKINFKRQRGWDIRDVCKFLFEKCNRVSESLKDQLEKEKIKKLSRENLLAEGRVIPAEIHDENLVNAAKLFKNIFKRAARDSGYELAGLTSTAEEINHRITMKFHNAWKVSKGELSFKETIDDALSNVEVE